MFGQYFVALDHKITKVDLKPTKRYTIYELLYKKYNIFSITTKFTVTCVFELYTVALLKMMRESRVIVLFHFATKREETSETLGD